MREHRVIIAGSGGQGILFLGKLVAYSAMIEGKEVTWFPSYGAEIRGGTANCTVVVASEMIGSPVVRNPNYLIVMNEASYNRFIERLLPGGLLVVESSLSRINGTRDDISTLGVPALDIAARAGNTRSANMVMVGAFIAATQILSIDSVFAALHEITPPHKNDLLETNRDLIRKGYRLCEDKKG